MKSSSSETIVTAAPCSRCQKPKSVFLCGVCADPICKSCTEFLEGDFSYMKVLPLELQNSHFCQSCYISKVTPARQAFNEIMRRARTVTIFDKPLRRPPNILKSSKEFLQVADCLDQPDTFLRLAFFAAEMGFNSVMKVKVEYTKVRVAGYQNFKWAGSGFPAVLGPERLSDRTKD
jgi:hypothetical protein